MMTGFTPINLRKASRRSPITARQSTIRAPAARAGSLVVVFDIGEPLVAGRGPFERSLLIGTPGDELLDLSGELEVLVGDPLGGVGLQLDLDPRIGSGDIRMMPGGLGEMADRVDHHQRPLPARGAEAAPDPAVFVAPVRKLALEPGLDLVRFVSSFFRFLGHECPPIRQAAAFGAAPDSLNAARPPREDVAVKPRLVPRRTPCTTP